jgi:predicted nucleic acid-binding protein
VIEFIEKKTLRLRLRPLLSFLLPAPSRACLPRRISFIDVSPDPYDSHLLALAEAGRADVLASGDKRDVLALGHHGSTRTLTARDGLALFA